LALWFLLRDQHATQCALIANPVRLAELASAEWVDVCEKKQA
jgi:hypothetical protein